MPHRDGDEVLTGERDLSGQHLVEHDAERVDVGLLVDVHALRLLGRDVVGRAEHRAGLGHPALDVERAGDAEVGDLRLAVAVQQDVLRLDVAMDETVAVREREPARDLDRQLERRRDRQWVRLLDQPLEVVAADELEHDELLPTVLAPVDDRDDVRVREDGRRASLAPEPFDVLRLLQMALVEDLERDRTVEQPVVRPVDARHAAGADELLELVAVQENLPDHPR